MLQFLLYLALCRYHVRDISPDHTDGIVVPVSPKHAELLIPNPLRPHTGSNKIIA
jgi:hypothetical protein